MADPLLQWPPRPYGEVLAGANPIALDASGANVYVGTVGSPAVIRIPVEADGSAGKAVVVAKDLAPIDGLELDESGRIYVSEPSYDRIYAISPDGKQRTLIATGKLRPCSIRPASCSWTARCARRISFRKRILVRARWSAFPDSAHPEAPGSRLEATA